MPDQGHAFLQDGSPSTLNVYVAAIAAKHDAVDGKSVRKPSLVIRFLRWGKDVKSSAPSSGSLLGSPLGPGSLERGNPSSFCSQ